MLNQLTLSHFRNIAELSLTPASEINLLLGPNGSGKTSILEAIYLLSHGRSFRSRSLKHVVEYEQEQFQIFGRLNTNTPVGLQFNHQSGIQIRFNNAPLKRLSDLAMHMPVQFISANCHQFFELGPRFRRKLVDWGLFHVEPGFNFHWQSYRRILQQRNSAIRQHKSKSEIQLWNSHLALHGDYIHKQRMSYLNNLVGVFDELFKQICPDYINAELTLKYQAGWNQEHDLERTLNELHERDISLGYTRSGVHAADWSVRINKADPQEMLSRGQQKLFFLAIVFSQIKLLAERQKQNGILLVDDLTSELDDKHQKTVIDLLQQLNVQSYITSTSTALSDHVEREKAKVFHVEHGCLK